jgi:LysR family transcriptional regulator for metE and metH
VSRALGVVERKLGMELFERSGRGLVPTAVCNELVAEARRILGEIAALETRIATPRPRTRVRLVCECYTAYRWLPSALQELSRAMPAFDLQLAVDQSALPVEALMQDRVDIALLTTAPLPRRAELDEAALFADEIVFVVAADHPLTARPHITPADLTRFPLLNGNTPHAEQQWFMNAVFGRSKPKLEMLNLPLTEALIDAARAGLGVAAMSEWIAAPYLDSSLAVLRLARGPLRRGWRIAFRREAADVATMLAGALAKAAPSGRIAPRARSA